MRFAAVILSCLLALSARAARAQDVPGTGAEAPQLLLDSARQWQAQHRPDLARLALQKLLLAEPGNPRAALALGQLEADSGNIDAARRVLDELRRVHPDAPATAELDAVIRLATQDRLKLATARRYSEIGRDSEAAQAWRELFPQGPPEGDYAVEYWTAQAQTPAGRAAAREALLKLANAHPDDPRYSLAISRLPAASSGGAKTPRGPSEYDIAAAARRRADAALAAGHPGAALRLLEPALDRAPANAWLRYDLARLYQKLDLPKQALAMMDDGLQRAPRDADMHYAAALVRAGADRDAEALAALNAVPARERSTGMRALEQRLRARIAAPTVVAGAGPEAPHAAASEDDGFITWGVNRSEKSGKAGISRYQGWQAPVEARFPLSDAHLRVHVDPVSIDAGRLPAVYDRAALFGQVQARDTGSLARFPNGDPQHAEGVDVGIAYERENFRVDLGSTPVGFPVENIVGGVRGAGELSVFDWRLEASRRPVTGTLLSYAGARDPVTGKAWGGVVATGGSATLGFYGHGPVSGQISVGWYELTGRNVKRNDNLRLRIAPNWTFVETPDDEVSVGLAFAWWKYREALDEFTFGHGGYYSPQNYLSLALPLEWDARRGHWSWLLRAAVSESRTHEDDEDFYPNDRKLQALAAASTLPAGYSRPVYDGGDGGGFGYSLHGALEYRVAAHWFLGAHAELERSEFYAPNLYGLYLRYDFSGRHPAELSKTSFPPRPPEAYSDY